MKLYFIHAEDGNGETLDSLIEAESPEQAEALWREDWFFLGGDEDTNDDDVINPAYIGEVKVTGVARVIPWKEIIP